MKNTPEPNHVASKVKTEQLSENLNNLAVKNINVVALVDSMKSIIRGINTIENCLKDSVAADPSNAPFPLSEKEAKLWHLAQMEAYKHALEMIMVSPKVLVELGLAVDQSTAPSPVRRMRP